METTYIPPTSVSFSNQWRQHDKMDCLPRHRQGLEVHPLNFISVSFHIREERTSQQKKTKTSDTERKTTDKIFKIIKLTFELTMSSGVVFDRPAAWSSSEESSE